MEALMRPSLIPIVLGLCAGVLSGILGVGSGLVLIPALVLLLDFPQKSAQGISLAVMVPMTLVGAIRYQRNPQVQMNAAYIGLIAVGAVIGAAVGAGWAQVLPAATLKKVFALFIIAVGIRIIVA